MPAWTTSWQHVLAKGDWEDSVVLQPVALDRDYAARVIGLLVERLGGRVELTRSEIAEVPARLILLPEDTENGFRFETRRLAVTAAEPDQSA